MIGAPRDFDKNVTEPTYFDNKSIDVSIPLKETNEIIKITNASPKVSKSTVKTEDNSEVLSVQNGGGSSAMDL